MNKLPLLIFILLVTGCVSRQCSRNDSRSVAAASDLTFEDLATASNVIVQTFDKTSNICGIADDKIFSLPQQWQAVIDERFQVEKERYLKKTDAEREAFGPSDCEKACSCGIYSNFYDYLDQAGVKFSPRSQDRWGQVSKAASELSLSDPRCVQDAEWFCRSRFIQDVIKN